MSYRLVTPRTSTSLPRRRDARRHPVYRNLRVAKPSRVPRGMLSKREHSYTRTITSSLGIGNSNGVMVNTLGTIGLNGSAAYDIEFDYSLSGVQLYLGGAPSLFYDMPNLTDFTNLYDSYRIDSIQMCVQFTSTNSGTSSPNQAMPVLYHCIDYNDVGAVNLSGILQYDNLKTWACGLDGGVMKKIRFTPLPQEFVYYSSLLTGYEQGSSKKWKNSSVPGIKHYGNKMFVDPQVFTGTSQVLGNLTFQWKYTISCKNTK